MEWIILSVGGINSLLTVYSYKSIPASNFIKKYFLYFLIITSLWIFSNFILRLFTNFFWFKMSYAIGSMIAPVALILVISFSIQKKLSNTLLLVLNIIAILFFISSFVDNVFFIKNNYPNNNAGYTLLFFSYPVFLSISLLYCLYKLMLCIKNFNGIFKLQAFYIFLGLLSFGLFTLIVSFILPILGYSEFAKLDTCGLLFFVSFTLYAIVRYHIMDIYFVIKKSSLHTFMIAFTTIVYITVMFFFENMLHLFFKYTTIISRIIAGTIIALTFLPIYNKLKLFFDKLFFKERIEYLQSLNDFSQNLITILDLRVLMRSIVENIHILIKVEFVSLFSFDNTGKIYKMESFAGSSNIENDLKDKIIYQNSQIVSWLKNNKEIEIKSKLIKGDTDNIYTPMIVQMEELNAELVIPLFFDKKLTHILIIGEKNNQDIFSLEELNLLKSLANQASIAFTNAATFDKLKRLYFGTIEAFIKSIESKDTYSHGHSYRVVDIATKIGIEYGLNNEQIELIKYASVLHDVGRIGIPINILTKPDKLTKKETEVIRKYPKIGSEIISSIEYFEDAAKIILHQHERWDGKGYPDNLRGEQIPLISRIIFVADAFDAMISNRSYRPALNKEAAINEIKNESGKQFDPSVVDYFISLYNKNLID